MNSMVVLVVDDEPAIRRILIRLLGAHERVEVLQAANGLEALAIMEREAVHMVITDEVMPKVTGVRLLEAIRARWPAVTRVLFTGHPHADIVMAAVNRGGVHRVLVKGDGARDLRDEIGELVEAWLSERTELDAAPRPVSQRSRDHEVVVVSSTPALRPRYERALAGYVVRFADPVGAIATVAESAVDTVLLDLAETEDPLGFIRRLRAVDLDCPVVVVSGRDTVDLAHEALAYGAYRYVVHPFAADGLGAAVRDAVGLRRVARLRREAGHAGDDAAWALSDRASLDARFAKALGEIFVVFQPIVSQVRREVHGYEALVRSREPTLANPGALFDAARRLDRVPELGRTIRKRALEATRDRPNGGWLFLNLDVADLEQADLLAPPLSSMADRVVLEVTERTALESVDDVAARVAALRAIGYRIAVDDLGAGYAGLTSFAALQPDVVKLDMSLVRDIHRAPVKQRLVSGLQEACRDLGVLLVGEGVETREELRALETAGCELFQGYLFARPAATFPDVAWC